MWRYTGGITLDDIANVAQMTPQRQNGRDWLWNLPLPVELSRHNGATDRITPLWPDIGDITLAIAPQWRYLVGAKEVYRQCGVMEPIHAGSIARLALSLGDQRR